MIGRAGTGRRQRRRERGHQAGDRGRQRPRVELGGGRRAHARPGARPVPERSPGALVAGRGRLGAVALRRQRAVRQDAGRDRLRPHRPARRPPGAGVRDGGGRLRQVRRRGALPRARRRARRDERRALRGGGHRHDPPAEDARHRQLDRRRGDREDEGRGADRQLRPRRAGRPRGARRRRSTRARSPARRSTSSPTSRSPSTRCSGATTSSSRRTSAPRPRRRRTAPGRSPPSRCAARSRAAWSPTRSTSPPSGPRRWRRWRRSCRCARSSAAWPRGSATARSTGSRPSSAAGSPSTTRACSGIAVLVGILSGHTEEQVNLVNAPAMAEERGIELVEIKDTASDDFTELVTVRIESGRRGGRGRGHRRRPAEPPAPRAGLGRELLHAVRRPPRDLPLQRPAGDDRPRRHDLRRARRQHRLGRGRRRGVRRRRPSWR